VTDSVSTFETLESNVRSYCRRWPAVFASSFGSHITDVNAVTYLDFFAGAGALSYGHNNPVLVDVAIDHLRHHRLLHSLDTFTPEKRDWLETLSSLILEPRGLDHIVQTVGPTGATAVEAALQLAQNITGARGVIGYAGGYHGMTYRTASVSDSMLPRSVVSHVKDFIALPFVETMTQVDLDLLDSTLENGVDGEKIGAILLESVQGEGGARPFDPAYLAHIRSLATKHKVLVIADEVQAGVGRTGPFFSFEGSGLDPDIICLSKSISGLGLPMALNLVRRSLDAWSPGEFTGTFRGNNLAFATSSAMLRTYWQTPDFETHTLAKAEIVSSALDRLVRVYGAGRFTTRGQGLLRGLDLGSTELANSVAVHAFESQLIVETCGHEDTVVKLLMPLTTSNEDLTTGLEVLEKALVSSL
jgi:diaminobutyrate-2-oxoglutarate transaminase